MSRVEDDREAARVAEKLLQQKQQAEAKAKERATSESAFAKLVKEGQQQKGQVLRKDAESQKAGNKLSSSILEAAMEEVMASTQQQTKDAQTRGNARLAGKAFNEKLHQDRAGEGERMGESRAADQEHEGMVSAERGADARSGLSRAEGRQSDAKQQRDQDDKDSAASARSALGRASKDKGDVSADADSGGQGGQGGDKKDGGGQDMAAGFRFNPALMAPVPVAKPKDSGASDRLRRLATEIAQKIVERVRVGTNAAGQAEFQIDLRSNVLAGLSIKVSGGNGKIKAVFSGNDREVLKLLREQSEGLKSALAGRGLALEELKIEEKA